MHVNVGAGSYLEINIPTTVGENGKLIRLRFNLHSEDKCKEKH